MSTPDQQDDAAERVPAQVIKIEGKEVWVATHPVAACARCQSGQGCGAVAISRLFCRNSQTFKLEATGEFREGMAVELLLPARTVLNAALWAYGLPLMGLVLGAAMAGWWWNGQEIPVILAGLAGFILALGLVGVRSRRLLQHPAYQPHLVVPQHEWR